MNMVSRMATGIVIFLIGVLVVGMGLMTDWELLFYGIPITIVGIVIFLNKNEDVIEEIKSPKNFINKKS